MQATDDNLPVLLDLDWDGIDLTLRIDPDPLSQHGSAIQIVVLTLYGCRLEHQAFDTLINGIGKIIEYNLDQESQASSFQFFIDYWADEVAVTCQRWKETKVKVTPADLLARSKHIAAWYAASLERYAYLEQQHDALAKLIAALKTDIAQQQDRLHRKMPFFTETNPAKAETLKACIKIYERLAYLLEGTQTGDVR